MFLQEFPRVPDDGGDRVSALQRLADQVLTRLARGSQHRDPHPHTLEVKVSPAVREEDEDYSGVRSVTHSHSRPPQSPFYDDYGNLVDPL